MLVLPGVGHLHPIFKPHRAVEFLYEHLAPLWGICTFSKRNDKWPTNAQKWGEGRGGGGYGHAWN